MSHSTDLENRLEVPSPIPSHSRNLTNEFEVDLPPFNLVIKNLIVFQSVR